MSFDNEKTLPRGWTKASIGELVGTDGVFIDGDWVESKDQDPDGDVRLIQLADVGDGKYQDRSSRFLTSGKAAELRCTFLTEGDVLIARMPDPLGRACIFPGDSKKAVTVVDVCIVRTGRVGANHRWLTWAINSPDFRSDVAGMQSGSTRKRISRGNLSTLFLPIPPIGEQIRIADEVEKQLTRLDAAVLALKRTQVNLKRYRAAVLKDACEGRLVPTEAEVASREGRSYEPASAFLERVLAERRGQFEASDGRKRFRPPEAPDLTNLKALPEGWTWASLDQLFVVERGRFSIRPRNDPNYYGGQHPFVQIGDLPREGGPIRKYQQSLNDRGLAVSKMFRAGTVLIAIVGATIANTGVLTFDSCCPDSLVAFQGGDETVLQYAEMYLRSVKLILRRASYASGGQPNINLGTLQPYPIPLPPYQELRRIVFELDRQFSAIEKLESQVFANLKRAARLRQSVLKSAFEGKLAAQDPADEPAGLLLERIRSERNAKSGGVRPKRRQREVAVP